MKRLQSEEAFNSPSAPQPRLSALQSCSRTGSSEEEEGGDGALQARKGRCQVSIPVVQVAGEPDLTNKSFQHCWNAQYLFLKARYLRDNGCQALFIGLNARSFRVHFSKLFSRALRVGFFFLFSK